MFLLAWKLNETKSPNEPIGLPRQLAPKACAASSMTLRFFAFESEYSLSRSTGNPARSTGMIAFVFFVVSTSERSMLRVFGSTSTNTGRAPTSRTTLAVDTQESGVVMTSSPAPTPASRSAISMVIVPELYARTGRPPQCAESAASNAFACGPVVIQPERSTSATPAMVASSMLGRVNGRNSGT